MPQALFIFQKQKMRLVSVSPSTAGRSCRRVLPFPRLPALHSAPTRDNHSRCVIADGHVEMVDSVSPPPSPVLIQDHNLISPPRRSSNYKRDSLRVPRRTEPAPAPPERPSKVRTIDPRDRLSPRPISPDPASGCRIHIPIVVRPPTTLCMCIVSRIPSVMLTISKSVRSHFGGTPHVLLLPERSTHYHILFAAQHLSLPAFVSTNPLQTCPLWVLSRASALSCCCPTPSLDHHSLLCPTNVLRCRAASSKPQICGVI